MQPLLGGGSFEWSLADQLARTNSAGLENTLFVLKDEPLGPEIIAIGGLQSSRRTGVRLDNKIIKPPVIHSNKAIAAVAIQGYVDRNSSLGSL